MLWVIRTVVILGGFLLEGVRRDTLGQADDSLFLDLGTSYMDAPSLWKFTELYTKICIELYYNCITLWFVLNFLDVEKRFNVYFYNDYFVDINSVKLINLNSWSLDSCEVFNFTSYITYKLSLSLLWLLRL